MPVVTSVSQATRPVGSARSTSSRTASEIWSATLSGWPSVTDSDVNRWMSRSLIVRTSGMKSTDGTAFQDAVEECRQGVKGGQGDGLAPRLEAAGQRAGDAAAAPGAGDGEGDLGAVEPRHQPLRELHGAARPPGLAQGAAQDRPVADEVPLPAIDVQRFDAALGGDVEMVVAAQAVLQLHRPLAGMAYHLLVGDQEPHRLLLHRLRHHGHRHRLVQPVVKEAEEAVAHAEELVGGVPRHRHLDPPLEPLPEISKIHSRDHQSSEPKGQGYSPAPAK